MAAAQPAPRRSSNNNGLLTYLCVVEDGSDPSIGFLDDLFQSKQFAETIKFHGASSVSFHPGLKRYTRFHLRSALKFMGCKNIDSVRIVDTIFSELEKIYNAKVASKVISAVSTKENNNDPLSVTLSKSQFHSVIRHSLTFHDYSKPYHMTDFPIACDVQDRKYSFTILLGGTSGCGKSTIGALLASRIGFSAVLSTDNVRQIMRKFIPKAEAPILWASTYQAGEVLADDTATSHKDKILKGYEAQNEIIFKQLDVLIGHYEARNESLIIEGVHLDTRLIMRLVKNHPTCIPFLMYISNEDKHRERFAIRSKYMTLDPHQNKYTKYFKNIRIINDYLCNGADVKMIPQIDNTNMDRSLATIHATIFNCLRRHVINHEEYYNREKDNMEVVHDEYEAMKHRLWSSKGMLRVIRKKKKHQRGTAADAKLATEEGGKVVVAAEGTHNEGEPEDDGDDDDGEEETEVVAEAPIEVKPPNPQHEDPENGVFNSDDEEEAEPKERKEVAAIHPSRVKGQNEYDYDSDDDGSEFDEYFMDCGSVDLGS